MYRQINKLKRVLHFQNLGSEGRGCDFFYFYLFSHCSLQPTMIKVIIFLYWVLRLISLIGWSMELGLTLITQKLVITSTNVFLVYI